ncbi:MAG: ferredoxin--NADP reductase [Cytophagaceae bacterium]|nr:ferredoxin--NADP reductase [Cytophagaceae bacterium]
MKSYFLQVKEVIRETEDTVTILFWHPLSEQIKYLAGQFLTVSIPGPDGKKVKRSYSMSTSPASDTAVGITVKRVHKGLVSNYLNDQIKTGDFLEVIEPMGNFTFNPATFNGKHLILIGAGSGITPLMSIAKTALKTLPGIKVSLLYGSRNENQIIFKKELDALESTFHGRFGVTHIISQSTDTWVGLKGRIHQANTIMWLKEIDADLKNDQIFVCGPEEIIDNTLKIAELYDIPKERMHYERFNAPVNTDSENEGGEELKKQTVTVKYDGETHEFEVEPHQTILEAALDQNIELPYSCQAGMCTACLGKCTSGKIKMDEEEGLTDKEIEQGYVLTCVSHPITEGVILEID